MDAVPLVKFLQVTYRALPDPHFKSLFTHPACCNLYDHDIHHRSYLTGQFIRIPVPVAEQHRTYYYI